MFRGEDPEGTLSRLYFCGVAKMFLQHICLDGVHIPKFFWHKNRIGAKNNTFTEYFLRFN